MNFEDFILTHQNDDCAKLLMSSVQWPETPVPEAEAREVCVCTIEARKRIAAKLPHWHADPGLVYPTRLSGEQCSSESTARYKARLASRILDGHASPRIADLTGGLGVDSMAMSEICSELLYNEMNATLCTAARHNFARLGARNISFMSECIEPGNALDLIRPFSPALIFLDPARRADSGRKVFLPEDCSPDIMALKDTLLSIADDVLVKLSPMADIAMLIDRLGPCIRELHVVGSGGVHGECKELLLWLQRGWTGEAEIVCADADDAASEFRFRRSQEEKAVATLAANSAELEAMADGAMLFEPSSAMMKAGAYRLLCPRYGLTRLGRGVQLYMAPAGQATDKLSHLGKLFKVLDITPFGKQAFKSIAALYPRCEVTARNLPIDSESLRKKMGVKPGGDTHIFGAGCDFDDRSSARYLIVSQKI